MEQENLVGCTPIILSQRFDNQVFGQVLINRESFTVDHSQYLQPNYVCIMFNFKHTSFTIILIDIRTKIS